jgi:hypothetical protein
MENWNIARRNDAIVKAGLPQAAHIAAGVEQN